MFAFGSRRGPHALASISSARLCQPGPHPDKRLPTVSHQGPRAGSGRGAAEDWGLGHKWSSGRSMSEESSYPERSSHDSREFCISQATVGSAAGQVWALLGSSYIASGTSLNKETGASVLNTRDRDIGMRQGLRPDHTKPLTPGSLQQLASNWGIFFTLGS